MTIGVERPPVTVLSVRHETTYHYDQPAVLSHHLACLMPRGNDVQAVRTFSLWIYPSPDDAALVHQDVFGNFRHHFSHSQPHVSLQVVALSTVAVGSPVEPTGLDMAWEAARDTLAYRAGVQQPGPAEFALASALTAATPALAALALAHFRPGRPLRQAAFSLMRGVHAGIAYQAAVTDVGTTAAQALGRGQGVCQDLAHVMMAAMRSIGLAARYVSGYLLTDPPPGQPRLIGADASHAWVEVWCPLTGWWPLDPTNACAAGAGHVVLAWGRDYADVAPLRGVVQGAMPPVPVVAVTVAPA
ncbi:MAG: transglutaminase domain-containing protein [Aquabacterium sp.]